MSMTQRDAFISELFEIAKNDKDVYFISVDMGAPSLDRWREELPQQFMSAGISEQHAINFAAGLASQGKKVYVYFMAAWAARCFEQIRYSCALPGNPITVLGNGVGLGYAPAGPAHETNEDISYMRSLHGMHIHCPINTNVVRELVRLSYEDQQLRWVRLERKHAKELDNLYSDLQSGNTLNSYKKILENHDSNVALVSFGYMQGRVHEASSLLSSQGIPVDIFDITSPKPLDRSGLASDLSKYEHVVVIEEQSLDGGVGSIIAETLMDNQVNAKLLRIGLPDRYIFENGSRDYHLDNEGLSSNNLAQRIKTFIGKK